MHVGEIYRAWLVLLLLSLVTTALTLAGDGLAKVATGGILLLLAGAKARMILSRYLDLRNSIFWMRSFDMAMGLFLTVVFGLYVGGTGSGG